jgi:VWFA-related protein
MNAERIMLRSIGALFLAAVIAAAQQPPPEPTFRAGTELVQVSVVAQDKQGKPIADLRREEFQIFDNGAPQEARLFLAETGESNSPPPERELPNTFTNRIASPAGSHSGYSAILIDNLYTDFGDPFIEEGSGVAKVRTLEMLRSMPAGERIAIYALGRKLQVICEFTSNRDLLERQLRSWKPHIDTPGVSLSALSGDPGRLKLPQLSNPSADAAGEAARIDALQRASAGDEEMDLVADHLTGIPGRKNLIWISGKFVIGPRAIQKLNSAAVAIYPVDVAGVCTPVMPCGRLEGARPTGLMDGIAAATGGVAYYLRNDLDVAIREAMDDGRFSYTLGFYPSGDDGAAQVHQLAVKVSRPGVVLRYRTSYQTEAPRPGSGTTGAGADLLRALNRPIDATAIPVRASVKRARDRLNLEAMLDVGSLDLMPAQNLWTGRIEIVARFTTADGIVAGDPFAQTLTLNFNQTTYETAVRNGLLYHREVKIPARAVELKLLFANPASGKIGTLTIPLSKVTNE